MPKCNHLWTFLEDCSIQVPLAKKEITEEKERVKIAKQNLEKYKNLYRAWKEQDEYCKSIGVWESAPWRDTPAQKKAYETRSALKREASTIAFRLGSFSLSSWLEEPESLESNVLEKTAKSVKARRYHCQKCLAITEKKV